MNKERIIDLLAHLKVCQEHNDDLRIEYGSDDPLVAGNYICSSEVKDAWAGGLIWCCYFWYLRTSERIWLSPSNFLSHIVWVSMEQNLYKFTRFLIDHVAGENGGGDIEGAARDRAVSWLGLEQHHVSWLLDGVVDLSVAIDRVGVLLAIVQRKYTAVVCDSNDIEYACNGPFPTARAAQDEATRLATELGGGHYGFVREACDE